MDRLNVRVRFILNLAWKRLAEDLLNHYFRENVIQALIAFRLLVGVRQIHREYFEQGFILSFGCNTLHGTLISLAGVATG
jgi:hypothetical protein